MVRKLFIALGRYNLEEAQRLLQKYEKYISPATLVTGFIIDSLTLTRADTKLDNLILLSYLVLAGTCILILNAHDAGRFKNEKIQRALLFLPYIIQFAFGGLFSGFVVLYSRSASLYASWPFIIALAFLLIGNEKFRDRYRRSVFQISIYFIAIFSYLIFAVPVVLDKIGPLIFVISGAISLAIIYTIIYFVGKVSPQIILPERKNIRNALAIIFVVFNLLYFGDIIPPIPLALKQMIIAHEVSHAGSNFLVKYEKPEWYNLFHDYNPVFHRLADESVYAFSTIYAPANLRVNIVHEWSYYDENKNDWVMASRLTYSIYGGREEGFRGFSLKNQIAPGNWKVVVKTQTGQTLGQTKFKIIPSETQPSLIVDTR